MKFYSIIEKENEEGLERASLLKMACKKKNLDFVPLVASDFNYVTSNSAFREKAIIFRSTPGKNGKTLEKYLLNEDSASIYSSFAVAMCNRDNSFFYNQKAGLPVVKSIPSIHRNRSLIQGYVDFLGGFPIILKVTGNSHGVGVIKVDSLEGLLSLVDYLSTLEVKILLRQFIPHKKQGRLIVVGNKVVASYVNHATLDFRTNVGEKSQRSWDAISFSQELKSIALKAAQSIGIEFAGVDILFDEKTDSPYISEVNYPCDFALAQHITGIDIALGLVDHLVNKLQQKSA